MKRIVNKILSNFGYIITKKTNFNNKVKVIDKNLDKNTLLNQFFTNLKKEGFNPEHIIDVGAHKGDWSRLSMKYFPNAHYTLIEPQENLRSFYKDLISNPKISVFNVGASDKDEILNFTLVERADCCNFRIGEIEAK